MLIIVFCSAWLGLRRFTEPINNEWSSPFLPICMILNDSLMKVIITQSLVVVLSITCQSEQCRSHFLTALVQVLPTQYTYETKSLQSSVWYTAQAKVVYTQLNCPNLLIKSVCFSDHLYEFSVALIISSAVIVLQKLSQQSNAFLHLLNGVHPLWHLLCSSLILNRRDKSVTNVIQSRIWLQTCTQKEGKNT